MVSANNISWFHCGRCGSLFQAPAGELEERACSNCGRNPSLGIEAPAAEPELPPFTATGEPSSNPPARPKRSQRRRRKTHFMFKLLAGWLLILLTIVFMARWLLQSNAPPPVVAVAKPAAKPVESGEDIALLDQASHACHQAFVGFLSAGTPEARNQFVLSPITTAARMARFYSLNPMVNIDPQTLEFKSRSVIHLPDRKAIETQWSATDGRIVDAVFMEENGEWRLDWDHFARFSDYPWALFLAGSEKDVGEFRLLARERLAEERKSEESISLVLYAPRFGSASETGFQSPEFLVRRDSRNGRLLDAAFKLERSGKRVFGVNVPNMNPEGLIRVRVKVRRIEGDMGRRFEIEDVLACHWYSASDPGVQIPEQPDAK